MRGGQYGGDMGDSYYGGGVTGGATRPGRPTRPEDQPDPQTEQEIRLWSQSTPERKKDLMKSVHEQIMAEIGSIRVVAKEEEAKKTTAVIDGLMLARLERYDQLVLRMDEDARKAEERELKLGQRGSGRSTRGQLQGDTTQQNVQQRGRGRRR